MCRLWGYQCVPFIVLRRRDFSRCGWNFFAEIHLHPAERRKNSSSGNSICEILSISCRTCIILFIAPKIRLSILRHSTFAQFFFFLPLPCFKISTHNLASRSAVTVIGFEACVCGGANRLTICEHVDLKSLNRIGNRSHFERITTAICGIFSFDNFPGHRLALDAPFRHKLLAFSIFFNNNNKLLKSRPVEGMKNLLPNNPRKPF